ncbi:MAG: hypothetical protein ACK47R_08215, partial [Planctomycetia bacterium]
MLEESKSEGETKFIRAANALAVYDPDNPKWNQFSLVLAEKIVQENPLFLKTWKDAFFAIRNILIPQLVNIFNEIGEGNESKRLLAANLLADYASNRPDIIAELMLNSGSNFFYVFLPFAKVHKQACLSIFEREFFKEIYVDQSTQLREKNAARQANAAVAMVLLGEAQKIWPLFRHTVTPTVRSFLIHRFSSFGINPSLVVSQLKEEKDVSARRGLLLTLGEYDEEIL